MQSYKIVLSIFLLSVLLGSCRKESISTEIETNIPEPEVFIESEIYGTVRDENGNPLEGTEVNWGTSTSFTDQNGYFKIVSEVPDQAALLKVKKENFFEVHQVYTPFTTSKVRANVTLIEKTISGTLLASQGGIVNITGGGTVDFKPNSFIDESGTEYQGEVKIFSTYLSPSTTDLHTIMPGNLMGINANFQKQQLRTYGMVKIEIEGENGELLQVTEPAILNMPISIGDLATISNNANIALWYFDESLGLWIDVGLSSINGGSLESELLQSGWWNYGYSNDFIFFEGNIGTEDIYSFIRARITRLNDENLISMSISETGEFAGFVPKGKSIKIELVNDCNEVIYSEAIGSFDKNTKLSPVIINSTFFQIISIQGIAQNCDLEPVTNGYALIQRTPQDLSQVINIQENGNYISNLALCNTDEVSVTVVDLDEQTESISQSFEIQEDTYLGVINSCDEQVEARFTIAKNNGVIESYAPCNVEIQTSSGYLTYDFDFSIPVDNGTLEYSFYLEWDHNNSEYNILSEWVETGSYEWNYSFEGSHGEIIKVTENENPGDIIHFIVNDFKLFKQVNNTTVETFEGVTLDIKGVLQ